MELESKHALLTSIWRFSPESGQKNPHPAPFPITLPVRIISSILNDNDGIVLDPYCGSGTTLVASKLLNKNYIGIDISEEYIAYAKERLKNSQKELKAVQEELSKHIVNKTFKERKKNGEFTGKHKNGYILIEEKDNFKQEMLLENYAKYNKSKKQKNLLGNKSSLLPLTDS